MRSIFIIIVHLISMGIAYPGTNIELLDSLLSKYQNYEGYTFEFAIYNGDLTNHYSGDSIHVKISKKGDSTYIRQGNFEILQDGTYFIFANHLLKTISYAETSAGSMGEYPNNENPIEAFHKILKDTTSTVLSQDNEGKTIELNFDTKLSKAYFNRAVLYFDNNGSIYKSVCFKDVDNKVITYDYRKVVFDEQMNLNDFSRHRFIENGQPASAFSNYQLEKM